MGPKDRISRPFVDERTEPESAPPRPERRETPQNVPRPTGIPENVWRELGEIKERIRVHDRDIEALKNKDEITGQHKTADLQKKIEEFERKDAERIEKEQDKAATLAKERRERTYQLMTKFAFMALGGLGGLLVMFIRDCKVPAPVVSPPIIVPMVPASTSPASTADAGR